MLRGGSCFSCICEVAHVANRRQLTFILSENAEAACRPGLQCLGSLSHRLSPTLLMPRAAFRALKHLPRHSFWTGHLEDRDRACHGAVNSRHCFHFTLYGAASLGMVLQIQGRSRFLLLRGHVHTPLMQNKMVQLTCMKHRKEAAVVLRKMDENPNSSGHTHTHTGACYGMRNCIRNVM